MTVVDGNARLPGDVRPVRYALRLRLTPGADRAHGRAFIDVEVRRPTRTIELHGEGLLFDVAVAEIGDERHTLNPRQGLNGGLALDLPLTAPAGPLRLDLGWTTGIARVPEGLYSVQAGGADYLFTQFEPLGARRVFPCFDEPGYKARFAVTIEAPRGVTALSNGRCIDRRSLPEHLEWRFAETPPIASYLVAFAVGPFDLIEAPAGTARVPLRVVTTRGNGHLAAHALAVTPGLLTALEARIGHPYPYDKLDLVGVPDFAAGAMENVGLVTFRERLLLLDPDDAPLHDRMWAEIVIAHELAHMWFGNLVTMTWWDELWLNEAFATHLETAAVEATNAEYEVALEAVRETSRVMDHDSLREARAIRQPIEGGGDVLNAFDAITYGKGAAVVQMLRGWLGAEAFDAGVSAYLSRHQHGTATTDDLMAALDESTGQPVGPVLLDFLDQPGVPLLTLHPLDAERRRWRVAVRRYRTGDQPDEPGRWRVPVSLRFGTPAGPRRHLHVLTEPVETITLDAPADWVHPNGDERGYYRWQLPVDELSRLVDAGALTAAERVALPAHLWALVEAGGMGADDWCALTEQLGADPHRLVLSSVLDGLARLGRMIPDEDADAWAAFVRAVLAQHVDRLGPWPRPDDSANDRLARPEVVVAMADLGRDGPLRATLAAALPPLLADLAHADVDILRVAGPAAAWDGDEALLDRLLVALPTAPTPAHRGALVAALGSFRDPAVLERALESFLDGAVRAQDLFSLLRPAAQMRQTRTVVWGWLDRRHAAVVEKVGAETAAHLPRLGASAVGSEERARIAAFFAPPTRRAPGIDRILRQVLEGIDRSTGLSGRVREATARFLASRASAAASPQG